MTVSSAHSVPVIETLGLTKRFGSLTAVDSVDLRVEAGEVFGFLGPNGAGKSTTIRLLLDLIRPTSGVARVFGLDSRADAAQIHRRIGLVPSEVAMPRDLTAERYLAFRDELREIETSGARRELADLLGVELGRRLREMSTGNRQKVALIQALAHVPDLIILDEPSRGLDPLVQHALHTLLRQRVDDGATVFLSSHSISEVDRTADRVGIIRDGRLIAVEQLADIKARTTRRIDLDLAGPVDASVFAGLTGVDEVIASDTRVSARVRGSADGFLRTALAETEVLSVRSADADLEEIFLQYYRPGADT